MSEKESQDPKEPLLTKYFFSNTFLFIFCLPRRNHIIQSICVSLYPLMILQKKSLQFFISKSLMIFINTAAAAAAKLLQLCPSLCDPIDGSPPGSPVPGILQPRTLEWVAISFSNACKWKVKVKSLSGVPLFARDPMDCSLPGSSVHGIFQARVLEWVAIAFSNLLIQ